MKKFTIIDKTQKRIFNFDDLESYQNLERFYFEYCISFNHKWYWLNNMKVMVIK